MHHKHKKLSRKIALFSGVALSFIAFHNIATKAQTHVETTPAVQTQAQKTATETTKGNQQKLDELEAQKIEIIVRPKDNHDLKDGVAEAIPAKFENIPGGVGDLADGVTINGFGRYLQVDEATKIGQFIIQSVQKGDKIEALNVDRFVGQFEMKKSKFLNLETYPVTGYKDELIAALKRLQEEEKEDPEAGEDGKDGQDSFEQHNSQGDGGGAVTSNAGANDIAAGYETPAPLELVPTPEITSREVSCDVRVDFAQQAVIPQLKTEILEDGQVVDESVCDDGLDRYPIERNYALCSDDIDMDNRLVTAHYQAFYVGENLVRQDLDDCQPDVEKTFDIVEEHGSCTIQLDFLGETATPMSRLIYMDDNNRRQEVRSCLPSEEKEPVPLVQAKNGCALRHDFSNDTSYGQGVYTYSLDGVTYQASSCLDIEGETYSHVTAYKDDAGADLCKPFVDLGDLEVVFQSRKYITVDGLKQFVTECTPDNSGQAVIKTTDGCENPATWTHELTTGQSFGAERFYYNDAGIRTYVTECQASTKIYPHQTRISDYEMHDEGVYYYPLQETYINLDNGSEFIVQPASLVPGTPQIPYTYVRQDTVPTGVNTYSGCDAYRETAVSKIWDRPDGTQYNEAVGAGSSLGPVHACGSETITWARTGFDYINHNSNIGQGKYIAVRAVHGIGHGPSGRFWSREAKAFRNGIATEAGSSSKAVTKEAKYTGTRSARREDGHVFSETKNVGLACSHGRGDNHSQAKKNIDSLTSTYIDESCPTTPTNEQANTFNISVGW